MKHFTFESKSNFNDEIFKSHIEEAKMSISQQNGEVNFEEVERNNRTNKNYYGLFLKYKIYQSDILIGVLEVFRDNKNSYLNIYTSPVNRL
jgi:hypothetical protein